MTPYRLMCGYQFFRRYHSLILVNVDLLIWLLQVILQTIPWQDYFLGIVWMSEDASFLLTMGQVLNAYLYAVDPCHHLGILLYVNIS
jgi:hypothetical protein